MANDNDNKYRVTLEHEGIDFLVVEGPNLYFCMASSLIRGMVAQAPSPGSHGQISVYHGREEAGEAQLYPTVDALELAKRMNVAWRDAARRGFGSGKKTETREY